MESQNDPKIIPFRPVTAKFSGLQALRGNKTRPNSAVNKAMMAVIPRNPVKAENKGKTKKSYISREELLERLMYFQGQANVLKDENVRLRTRIKFLEKDSKRDDVESEKSHLVVNLKNQIKDLLKTIEYKDLEIADLKKNSRATRLQEIEIEMKMYIDECTRLRRMLQESFFQISQGIYPQDIHEKYIQQSLQLKSLKKDYKELINLSEDPTLKKSKTRKDLTLVKLKKNLMNTKEENIRVNEDNQRLLQELNSLRSNMRCPNCGMVFEENENKDANTIVWDIWQAVEHRKLTLDSAWNTINPEGFPDISPEQFKQGLERLGLYLSINEVNYFFPNTVIMTIDFFKEFMNNLRPADMISYEEMKEILMHLSYRLQVRRYEYNQVSMLFFPESRLYNQMEVFAIFQQEPISFTEMQAELFTKFLFGSSEALTNEECSARFYELLEPWSVLSEDEESNYDSELKRIVQGLGEKLLIKMEEIDKDGQGFITLEKFYEIFDKMSVEIDDIMRKYLELLFYTDQLEFNLVPYRNFFQAYNSQI
ncbi:hypothetical protein SteCoe_15588 [Stentor coeruleus]|uniref:EF-hand domain-containing protein n=1 Tax=Stentor coeruleus TaxID=5963 RepID=A0A1R2C3H4_9CILI|nr:hypothetical protein SteCoe_15588 [Stentor coeruleus]